ncbi:YwdI family protein [Lysinibacillus telephonicus]|uniref:Uncharacterized protein n=1 Tax=Lysinibacillus telephonicus TaxID=1714840 RepID=A0A3S0JTG5_9BACI|nr:YwdI family protein [Lysinibacillus telephonicus]RTQ94944.1 hypothetical protein EKG35_04660 [Lysinibacillus telephonicus]
MISYQALLSEIEQLVANAKNVNDEHQLREQLSAIRSLCNVALTNGSAHQTLQGQKTITSLSNEINSSQTMINTASSMRGAKLQENDANGDSIFDF